MNKFIFMLFLFAFFSCKTRYLFGVYKEKNTFVENKTFNIETYSHAEYIFRTPKIMKGDSILFEHFYYENSIIFGDKACYLLLTIPKSAKKTFFYYGQELEHIKLFLYFVGGHIDHPHELEMPRNGYVRGKRVSKKSWKLDIEIRDKKDSCHYKKSVTFYKKRKTSFERYIRDFPF